jgi:hypothetical protein
MSSNSNQERLQGLTYEFSQIPEAFAQAWTRMGGNISDEQYVTALGSALSLKFREIAEQWSLTHGGTDPQKPSPNGQLPTEQWIKSPSVPRDSLEEQQCKFICLRRRY